MTKKADPRSFFIDNDDNKGWTHVAVRAPSIAKLREQGKIVVWAPAAGISIDTFERQVREHFPGFSFTMAHMTTFRNWYTVGTPTQ